MTKFYLLQSMGDEEIIKTYGVFSSPDKAKATQPDLTWFEDKTIDDNDRTFAFWGAFKDSPEEVFVILEGEVDYYNPEAS